MGKPHLTHEQEMEVLKLQYSWPLPHIMILHCARWPVAVDGFMDGPCVSAEHAGRS